MLCSLIRLDPYSLQLQRESVCLLLSTPRADANQDRQFQLVARTMDHVLRIRPIFPYGRRRVSQVSVRPGTVC
jgi:hypothetical protein